MKNTNCPQVKNSKRKVALENLEKQLKQYKATGDKPNSVKRIESEIAILKTRVTR